MSHLNHLNVTAETIDDFVMMEERVRRQVLKERDTILHAYNRLIREHAIDDIVESVNPTRGAVRRLLRRISMSFRHMRPHKLLLRADMREYETRIRSVSADIAAYKAYGEEVRCRSPRTSEDGPALQRAEHELRTTAHCLENLQLTQRRMLDAYREECWRLYPRTRPLQAKMM